MITKNTTGRVVLLIGLMVLDAGVGKKAFAVLKDGNASAQSSQNGMVAVPMPGAGTAKDKSNPSVKPQPAYAPGRLIVKYKGSVTESVYSLLKQKRSFREATSRETGNRLDRLHRKYGVRGAQPVFRTELEEERIQGKRLHTALVDEQRKKWNAIQQRFSSRTRRGRHGLPPPDVSQVYVLELPEGVDPAAAASEFSKDPDVEYAHPDYIAEAAFTPTDPYYTSSGSWGQTEQDLWGLYRIHAGQAWDVSRGAGVLVAVVDTGVDYQHPELASNSWVNTGEIPSDGIDNDNNGFVDDVRGWDFVQWDGLPMDGNGHGTHVAGTIAAAANGVGIVGVAPEAHIMAVRALNDYGNGNVSNLAAGVVYAANNGADVINNSWGCSGCGLIPVVEDAVRTAHALGVVTVFAAGNEYGADVANKTPLNINDAKPIVVSATTPTDTPTNFTSVGMFVDVAAPGGGVSTPPPTYEPMRNILSLKSSVNKLPSGLVVGGNYLREAGTSMAAPHVAGLAALILSHDPDLTNEAVRQTIRLSADDVGAAGFDVATGAGRINAQRALATVTVPELRILEPSHNLSVPPQVGAVAVRGTAVGEELSQYALQWGAGSMPTAWTTIVSGLTKPVRDGIIGSFAVGGHPAGLYTLRLTGTLSGGRTLYEHAQISVEPRTESILDQPLKALPFPAMSDELVAWFDADAKQIRYYDLRTNYRGTITQSFRPQTAHIAVSGKHIVWANFSANIGELHHCFYDRASGTCPDQHLLPISIEGPSCAYPAISGDRIVWQQFDARAGTWDIYLCIYNSSSNSCAVEQVTTDLMNQRYPDVSGDFIVWQEESSFLDFDIGLYDRQTRQSRLVVSAHGHQVMPKIDQNQVVWMDSRNATRSCVDPSSEELLLGCNWDLYTCQFDRATGTCPEIAAATGAGDQYIPRVSGQKIVWVDGSEGNGNIRLYDVIARTAQTLAANVASQSVPVVSSQGVVWADLRGAAVDLRLQRFSGPPVLVIPSTQLAYTNQSLAVAVSAVDPGNPQNQGVQFLASGLPMGAAFVQLGDANLDGVVNAGDRVALISFLANNPAPTPVQRAAADVDRDGKLTSQDGDLMASIAFSAFPRQYVVAWVPPVGTSGTFPVMVQVTNPQGLSDSKTLTIQVVPAPPELAPIGDRHVAKNGVLSFVVDASDADGAPNGTDLIYSITGQPSGSIFTPLGDANLSGQVNAADNVSITLCAAGQLPPAQCAVADINRDGRVDTSDSALLTSILFGQLPKSYIFAWQPAADQAGRHPLTFIVRDAASLTASESIFIRVQDACYILTAAFGRPDHPVIQSLWQFHHQLLGNQWNAPWHQAYLRWYDRVGPQVAIWLKDKEWLKAVVRQAATFVDHSLLQGQKH